MTNATLRGKPDAGNPHVRFDEGEVASAKPRRGSLLYKTLKVQFVIAAALFAGVAIGYFAKSSDAEVSAADAGYVAKKSVGDKGEAAIVKALRKRIAELEKLLAEQDGKSEAAISNVVAEAVKNAPSSGRPHGNPREWMENLKKSDPARFAQMTNQFAQWRQRRSEQARTKMDFLSSIDTSHMSAVAKKTHDALQDLIARREEIEEQLHQEGLSDAERDNLMKEMWSTHHELQRLNGEERKNLIGETVRNLGFEGEDAQEISATIQDVIEATDSWGGGRRHGPPPGGPGPGGPGGR